MMRKVVGVVVVLAVCVGVAMAEEIGGRITKISDTKVTFEAKNKETKKYDAAKEYNLAKDVKVSMKKGKEKVAAEGGLKNEALVNIGPKGTAATINVEGGKVTEIVLGGKKKAAK